MCRHSQSPDTSHKNVKTFLKVPNVPAASYKPPRSKNRCSVKVHSILWKRSKVATIIWKSTKTLQNSSEKEFGTVFNAFWVLGNICTGIAHSSSFCQTLVISGSDGTTLGFALFQLQDVFGLSDYTGFSKFSGWGLLFWGLLTSLFWFHGSTWSAIWRRTLFDLY